MVVHRHLAYAYCLGHLLVRLPLQVAQTENLLAEGRLEVVDELGQTVEAVVGIGTEHYIGTVCKPSGYALPDAHVGYAVKAVVAHTLHKIGALGAWHQHGRRL